MESRDKDVVTTTINSHIELFNDDPNEHLHHSLTHMRSSSFQETLKIAPVHHKPSTR
jgi:hypothetical protein